MRRRPIVLALALSTLTASAVVRAQDGGKTVYRCPGPPVLYTDALSAAEAKAKDCRTIDGAPITIVQAPRRKAPGADAPAATAAAGTAPRPPASAENKVDPATQKARDTDSRRILEGELKREEEALANLRREFNNGEPERRGDERNFARYQERVAEMRAAIQRKEADIAALKRELAKLPS